jgi:hypothetical protein
MIWLFLMILLKIDETDPTVKQWLSVVNNINVTALSSWTNPVNHLEDTEWHRYACSSLTCPLALFACPFLQVMRAHIIIMQTDTYNLHGGTWFENINNNNNKG